MPARVLWYDEGSIVLFSLSDPLTLDELEAGAEEVWALAV